jgi:hypothetical protein
LHGSRLSFGPKYNNLVLTDVLLRNFFLVELKNS